MQDAVALALADPYANPDGDAAAQRPTSRQRQQELQRCFLQLVSNAFLVQCEPPLPVQQQEQQQDQQQQHTGRRRKAESKAALRKMPSKTADVPAYTAEDSDEEDAEEDSGGLPGFLLMMLDEADPAAKARKTTPPGSSSSSSIGSARQTQKQQQLMDSLVSRLQQQRVPFQVNAPFISLLLCKKAVKQFVVARVGDTRLVQATTAALLQAVRLKPQQQRGVEEQQTSARLDVHCKWLTFDALEAAVSTELQLQQQQQQQQPRVSVQKPQLIRLLDGLTKHPDRLLATAMKDGQAAYRLDWQQIKALMQRRIMSEAVLARCGPKAARVWRRIINAAEGPGAAVVYFDEQMIADSCLLPPSGARQAMYSLALAGFARFHESDRLPASCTSLSTKHSLVITCSLEETQQQVADSVLRAALNLLERKRAEAQHLSELRCRTQCLADTEMQQQRLREAAEDLLDANVLKLGEPLAILMDI
ncbi:hypothetical protein, conserved [Eimeria tenella]|uniref:DNA-directed RNA polymerase III subunit RPC3 n=1 Tax=Eimeria tenella TaxID=5802 RepID=U6KKQ3_EIMTE|nr:hypothetical protein, conserved [Eimeria tenella]CDJ38504.1 hypothetical protein, conserved [Eimeria tenella]|eukprot:XP_013229342.1 hypothetical protein, conserved [Eimeria tenella]